MTDKLLWELEHCLARMEAGESLEACLAATGPAAAALRPLLEAALAVRSLPVPPERESSREAGRYRLQAALAAARQHPMTMRAPFAYPLAAAGALAVIGLLIAVGFGAGFVHFGTSTTEARISGVASSVNERSLVLETAQGPVTVGLQDTTYVSNAGAAALQPQQIRPGSSVVIVLEARGDSLSALQIDVLEASEPGPDEDTPDYDVNFTGTVTQVGATSVTVRAPFGEATVNLTASTQVSGMLSPGATVEVHGSPNDDGSYTAEIITAPPASSASPQPQ